jgi:hypothetical protein
MQRGVRFGVAMCVGAAIAFGLVYLVRALDQLDEAADANATANYDDREFAGGNSLVVDKRALYEARSLIPERVIPGPNVAGATELTEPYIDQFARSFLMPRRPDPTAEWILCYGCERSALEVTAEVVWDNEAGISILKVSR